MKVQKYRRSLGRGRLSRNNWNIKILNSSPSFEKSPLKFDLPNIGPVLWDKGYKGPELTSSITNEFKDQFSAHQTLKTFYGDLNKFQLKTSLKNLEERLDVLVYRTGKPRSIFEARNLIKHGYVKVNDSLNTHISSLISLGSVILINFPTNYPLNKPIAPNPPHLWVRHLDNKSTLAIYKKPLNLYQIRYPKGFSLDKWLLVHPS